VIRTGRESHVALRVGVNATFLVERSSRVAIPEIVQNGDVLKTRVSMQLGRAEVRVDRVGLQNDFEVATPTATLAVRGTVFLLTWDAVHGFRAVGVRNNKLRAIEVNYVNGVTAALSQADASDQSYPLPAIEAFYITYIIPLQGAMDQSELSESGQGDPDRTDNPRKSTEELKIADKKRGEKLRDGGNTPGTPTDNPQQKN
jgi:hypothetical protein